jgi:signal transduction histidine kinase
VRDAWVVLPAALVLLLVLTSFTLLTYRSGVATLVEERQEDALTLARRAARRVASSGMPTAEDLAASYPGALRLVLASGNGSIEATAGEPLLLPFAAPLDRALGESGAVTGPGGRAGASIVAYVPRADGRRGWLRVDLSTPALASQQRTVSVLTWTGLGASAAVLLWLLLFLRQLLRPYEALLRRARELNPAPVEDESAFLLATVERALAPTSEAPREEREDLAALERTLAPSLESGLLLLDREQRVLALNPAGATLLGPAPPPRTPVAELLREQPAMSALLREALASGQGVQRQESEVLVRGEAHRVGLSVTPLRRARGELLGFLVLFADLTADERAQQQLRLAESLAHLGELSAGVAHELRNGLGTLAGYVGLLERNPGDAAVYAGELRAETQHLQRVVGDFLSFARPQTARLEPVDLVALARHAADDPALAGAAVQVDAPDAEPAAILHGDPQLLERALRNLLRNALEAQQRAGDERPLELEAGWRDGSFDIVVGDHGPGLSAEMRRRLFQPFASDRAGGVGLGLALAHRIVALHGGTLALEGRAEGGTRARMRFPGERFRIAR